MIQLRTETEDLLLSITENFQKLIHQTYTKPQQTLDFKLSQPKRNFFISFLQFQLMDLGCELYTDNFDEFSFEESKDELEEILSISDMTPQHLQHEKIGPRIFEAYKKLGLGKLSTDGYVILLMGYAKSPVRDFEGYLRMESDWMKMIFNSF